MLFYYNVIGCLTHVSRHTNDNPPQRYELYMRFQYLYLLKIPFIVKFLFACDISSMFFLNFFVAFSVLYKSNLRAIKVNYEKVLTSHPTTFVTPINKGIARGVTSVWRSHPKSHPRSHPARLSEKPATAYIVSQF